MCTPFSPKEWQGFNDHNSRTLIQFVRTVSASEPRVAILEYVPGILQQKHEENLQKLISTMKGYHLKIFTKIDSRDFGLPQSRVRVCLVFVKINVLNNFSNKCMARLSSILAAAAVDTCLTFREFFIEVGESDSSDILAYPV